MATFYQGYRHVLKGRNSNDAVHTWKGTAGTYSNWSLFNTSHVLDGAPDSDVDPGTGAFPYGLQMSRWFMGQRDLWPLDDAGGGARIDGMRFRPLTYRGLTGARVFASDFGHADRETAYSLYNNFIFDGVGTNLLDDPGHTARGVDGAGTAATFGAFDPYIYKGVAAVPESGSGTQTYGHDNVLEYKGLDSTKALNV